MKWTLAIVPGFLLLAFGVAIAQQKESVPDLIKQLQDKDEIVRLKAAKTLGKLGADAKDAIPALTDAMKDTDEDVRAVAKQALARVKDALQVSDQSNAIAALAADLQDVKNPDRDTRSHAVAGLTHLLQNGDELIRAKAARGLGEAGLDARDSRKNLEDAAKDPDEGVRKESRKALSLIEAALTQEKKDLAHEKLIPLMKSLKDKSPSSRQKALDSIGEMGADATEATQDLIVALGDRSPAVQQSAIDALEKVNPTLHRPVVALLVDQNPNVKVDAIDQIGRLGADGKPALPILFRLYQSQRPGGRAGSFFSIPVLNAAVQINPEDGQVQQLVLGAISISGNSVNPQYPSMILDSDIRQRAIVLGMELVKTAKLDAKRLVNPLLSALRDPGCELQAINAIGELGLDAKDAIPILTRLKLDHNSEVRDAATEALKKI